jgi:hypothetical protein
MKLHLDDTVIPLGTVRGFMYWWDEEETEEELDLDTEYCFLLDIKYPPLDYTGEIYWNEFSYNCYTQNSLTWSYDFYSMGNW